jgi:hypothetical protein
MGKLPNGPFGAFTGRIGNLVCYDLNGQIIIRTIGINNKPPTIKQQTNRMKMKVINELVQNTYLAMHAGFTAASNGTVYNYANLAIKHNNPNALKGVYPNVELDYPKILFSHGNLETPIDPKVEVVLEGLKFSWDPSTQCKGEDSQDQVSMVAYCPEKQEMLFIKSGQKRHQGWDILPIEKAYKGLALEIYMYFVADDRLDVSTTTYLGRIDPSDPTDKIEPLVIEQVYDTSIDLIAQSQTGLEALKSVQNPVLNKLMLICGFNKEFNGNISSFSKRNDTILNTNLHEKYKFFLI